MLLFMFLKLANIFASRKFLFIKVNFEFKPFSFHHFDFFLFLSLLLEILLRVHS